jgi:hypothetical protein
VINKQVNANSLIASPKTSSSVGGTGLSAKGRMRTRSRVSCPPKMEIRIQLSTRRYFGQKRILLLPLAGCAFRRVRISVGRMRCRQAEIGSSARLGRLSSSGPFRTNRPGKAGAKHSGCDDSRVLWFVITINWKDEIRTDGWFPQYKKYPAKKSMGSQAT